MNIFPKHTQIYTKEIPDFLFPFLEAPSIKRLHGISSTCWVEHTKFIKYKFYQSRLNHSLWVALIIWHFTQDKKQTLAWLFHDVSNSVFSHVGDFLAWDKLHQNITENKTSQILKNDPVISQELQKLWISFDEIIDYSLYPIADNSSPQLAADRLEYTMTWWYNLWHISLNEIQEIYQNISVLTNEFWQKELGFTNFSLAEKFAFLSIENDSKSYSNHKNNVSMSFLTEILKEMMSTNLVQYDDLFLLQEKDIIDIIWKHPNSKVAFMWNFFTNIDSITVHNSPPKENIFFVNSHIKKRYINPLVKIWNETKRCSELSKNLQQQIQSHINYPLEYISLNYFI